MFRGISAGWNQVGKEAESLWPWRSVLAQPGLHVFAVNDPEHEQDTLGIEQVVHDPVVPHPHAVEGICGALVGLDAFATALPSPHLGGQIQQGVLDPLTKRLVEGLAGSLC
jgi:hypothetical protein